MPTLLWRVLSYVGYPDGMEPHYFWANEQLGEGLLVTVEVVVRPRGDGSEWTGWRYESTGRTVEEAAERAAFGILRDYGSLSPGVGNNDRWSLPKGQPLH
jgi:hypothetical protein